MSRVFEYGNISIVDYSSIEMTDDFVLSKIVNHTLNTWQKDRSLQDKISDTKLGKLAENCVIECLKEYGINNYYSYDTFRKDNYNLHAPIDGVLIPDNPEKIFSIINDSVKNDGVKLSAKSRIAIRNLGARTVEIKATRIAQKYKDKVSFISYKDNDSIKRLIDYLNSLDYINYPFYKRYGYMTYDYYCVFVAHKLNIKDDRPDLESVVRQIEIDNSPDVFIRVFIDEDVKLAFIMGCIGVEEFFSPPVLKKLVQYGKSEVPLYFVKKIELGSSLRNINDVK